MGIGQAKRWEGDRAVEWLDQADFRADFAVKRRGERRVGEANLTDRVWLL